MISHLTGSVRHLDLKYAIIDVGGVGYKAFVTTATLEHLSHAEGLVSLWTYLAVRDDALDLYAFLSKEAEEFFELLLGVSGIGPKSALSTLNAASVETIKEAIYNDDPTYLTKVSGIGKKSAEKIVRELREKIGEAPTHDADGVARKAVTNESAMAIEALISLGFSADQAREAVKKTDKNSSTGEIVKQALKFLQ